MITEKKSMMRHVTTLSSFLQRSVNQKICRNYCTNKRKGLVFGVYEDNKNYELSDGAKEFDQKSGGKLSQILPVINHKLKLGKCRILYNSNDSPDVVAVVGLGSADRSKDSAREGKDENREAVRTAIAAGVSSLRDVGCDSVQVDVCNDAAAAAEGAALSLFSYDDLKKPESRKPKMNVEPFNNNSRPAWEEGVKFAEGQNLARRLMESPASHMTPTMLAEEAVGRLSSVGVSVEVRDEKWCREQGMGSFLSVTQGSLEPPVFIHATYTPDGTKGNNPLCIVGKGVTFDSGGISLKPSANMDRMRADMGGAAVTIGALYTIAALKLPIHIQAFIPSCENMPGQRATRPGDVVFAMNGKSIQVDNTDAEGRLILADALCYAEKIVQPSLILDIATLTGAMSVALGSAAAGVFTQSNEAWQDLEKAGQFTGDRVWRMPLWQHYTKQVTESDLADVNNIGKHSREGGSCTAAAFLKEFVNTSEWMHLDIAGVMENKDEVPYLKKGMSGRPARTVARLAQIRSQK